MLPLCAQVHTNTQLLAENSQKAVALRLGGDAMARLHSETAKARPVLCAHDMVSNLLHHVHAQQQHQAMPD